MQQPPQPEQSAENNQDPEQTPQAAIDPGQAFLKRTIASEQHYPTTMYYGTPTLDWGGPTGPVQEYAELPKEPGAGVGTTLELDWENSFIPKLFAEAAQPFLGPQDKEEWKKERQNTIETLQADKQWQATTTADKILDGVTSFAAQGALFAGGAAALTAVAPEALTAAIGTAASSVGLDAIAGTTLGKLGVGAVSGGTLSVLGDEFNNVTIGATGDPTVTGHEMTYNALLGAGVGIAGSALHIGANKLWQKYKLKNAPQEGLPSTPAQGDVDEQVVSDHLRATSNGEASDDKTLQAVSQKNDEEVNANPQAANDLVTEEPKLINSDMDDIKLDDSTDPKYEEGSLDYDMLADKIVDAREQIEYMRNRDVDIDKNKLDELNDSLTRIMSNKTFDFTPYDAQEFLTRYSKGDIPQAAHELIEKTKATSSDLEASIKELPDNQKNDLLGLDDTLKAQYVEQADIKTKLKTKIQSKIKTLQDLKEKIPHKQDEYLKQQIKSQPLQAQLKKISELFEKVGNFDATKTQIDRAGKPTDLANKAVQNVEKRNSGQYNLEHTPPVEGVIGQPFNTQPITENQIFDQLRDDYESGNMSDEAIDNMKDILINEVASEGDEDFFKATARCMTGQQLGDPNIDLKNKIDRIKNLQEGDKWPL